MRGLLTGPSGAGQGALIRRAHGTDFRQHARRCPDDWGDGDLYDQRLVYKDAGRRSAAVATFVPARFGRHDLPDHHGADHGTAAL